MRVRAVRRPLSSLNREGLSLVTIGLAAAVGTTILAGPMMEPMTEASPRLTTRIARAFHALDIVSGVVDQATLAKEPG